jgi:hypothetical protein
VVDVLEEFGVGAEPEELVGVSSVLELPCGVGEVPLLAPDGVSCIVALPRGVVDELEELGVGADPEEELLGVSSMLLLP